MSYPTGEEVGSIRKESACSVVEEILSVRQEKLAEESIEKSTKSGYNTVFNQYKRYCEANNRDPYHPDVNTLCLFLSHESLFVKPSSLGKYVSAIKKKLVGKYIRDERIFQNVMFVETLEGIYKRYGLPGKDVRIPMSIKLLVAIKVVKGNKHNERCCLAAAVIAFVCCLRIGEITCKTGSNLEYLKRANLKRYHNHGIIKLDKTKTDRYKQGTEVIYVKINNDMDPVLWMNKYVEENKIWKGEEKEPLFILENKKPLDRNTLIKWVRKKAEEVKYPESHKLNGISFRRGFVQTIKEQGFQFHEFSGYCRWSTEACANRYIRSTIGTAQTFAKALEDAVLLDGDW